MDSFFQNFSYLKIIFYTLGGLLALFLIKKILNFLGFSSKFTWGPINYWVVKKSRSLTSKEMAFLKKIGQSFRLTMPSSLVGNISSLDYYFRYYIASLYNQKMKDWTRYQILSQILEIRRKFAIIPLAYSKIHHSRQFAPGSKIRIGVKGKGFFETKVGESRYSFFTAVVPNHNLVKMLKKESKVLCKVTRLGDAQYTFSTSLIFVSELTDPLFAQIKHTRSLKRQQNRQDVRQKTDLLCSCQLVNMRKVKGGYVFDDIAKEEFSGHIKDLSSGGCSVYARKELTPGKFYKIRFRVVGQEVIIPVRVLRSSKTVQSVEKSITHFRFVGIKLKEKVLLQLFLYRLHPMYSKGL